MANRYEQNRHNHNIHNKKTISLPMFCRLSIKDVNQSCHRPNPTPAAAGEPSSPKVSCMGQVNRNNRITGYPTAAANQYHKKMIRKKNMILSRKALLPNTTAINPVNTAGAAGGRKTRISREMTREIQSRKSRVTNQDCFKVVNINIAEMDPPLPVVKRVAPPGGGREEVNIWERRFNGVRGGLRSLEIEKIGLPDGKFPPPPTLTVRRN
ncbi:hypothetical protein CASFOL_016674 [Castilleja foliolosa]|uniref:Uncharacterized protein n=1 Tax=Castilleja foliolosa TaxID=1961234 RepID=A0ABD3DAP7_9LAMI